MFVYYFCGLTIFSHFFEYIIKLVLSGGMCLALLKVKTSCRWRYIEPKPLDSESYALPLGLMPKVLEIYIS